MPPHSNVHLTSGPAMDRRKSARTGIRHTFEYAHVANGDDRQISTRERLCEHAKESYRMPPISGRLSFVDRPGALSRAVDSNVDVNIGQQVLPPCYVPARVFNEWRRYFYDLFHPAVYVVRFMNTVYCFVINLSSYGTRYNSNMENVITNWSNEPMVFFYNGSEDNSSDDVFHTVVIVQPHRIRNLLIK